MFIQHNCPACGSTNLVKNGSTYYGKARLKCKQCGRQFVTHRQHQPLSNECKRPVRRRGIELLLAERISLEGICRVLGWCVDITMEESLIIRAFDQAC